MAPCRKISAVVGVLCAVFLASPSPASARVVITVEVAFGSVVVGGVGFFLYLGGSREIPFADRDPPTSLLEIRDGHAHLGVPVPSLRIDADTTDDPVHHETIQFDLFRWRF